MCNISGYAGTKQAAPILIEMLKKQEFFDGGLSTGIATVDNEGNLYHAKVLGSVEDLLSKTDAINFPGNVGIIHSRPDDNFIEHAHPFVCEDDKTAIVLNGNACTDEHLVSLRNSIARYLQENCNMDFKSAVSLPNSTYPQLSDGRYAAYGEVMAKTVEQIRKETDANYDEALAKASSELFADVVSVLASANSPENIYVTRISRPMNIMAADDGCYISTSQLAFPDIENIKYIKSLPQMTSCVINKDGFTETGYNVTGGKVTEYTKDEYEDAKAQIMLILTEGEYCMDNMGGGIYPIDRSADKLRPKVKLIYDILWDFHKEGVLKTRIQNSSIPWLKDKTVKRVFFHI